MITLAIEQSSKSAGAALLDGETVLAERSWDQTWHRNQELFEAVPEMLAGASLSLSDVEAFAVGLGPGSFSGTRIAVSVVQAFALPDGKPVFGLSSGEALAWDLLCETDAKKSVVIGDARRQLVWYAVFGRGDRWPVMEQTWSLQPVEKLVESLPDNAVVAGPDWSRIGAGLKAAYSGAARFIEEDRHPRARTVGILAARKIRAGLASDPIEPIYLHPAVFVEPKQ